MPNVTTLLNQDHRKVEQMFAEFTSTKDFEIVLEICKELTVHSTVEEEIVYPVLEKLDSELEQEAEKEHNEVKQLVAKLQGMTPEDPQLEPTMRELEQAVQHHVEEEESQAWPKMERGARDELDPLGMQVEERKQELLTSAREVSSTTSVRSTGTSDFESMKKDELYKMAQEQDIDGRSSMTKKELIQALGKS